MVVFHDKIGVVGMTQASSLNNTVPCISTPKFQEVQYTVYTVYLWVHFVSLLLRFVFALYCVPVLGPLTTVRI